MDKCHISITIGGGLMKRADFILILTGVMLLISSFAGADTIQWITPGGSWHDPSNWSPIKVPHPGDDVVVNIGLISFDAPDITINSITLGASDGPEMLTLNSGLFTIDSYCINDPSTGLCWDNYDSGTLMNWADAGTYCAGRSARLPTIDELVFFASEGTVSFAGHTGNFYINGADTDLRPRLAERGYGYTGGSYSATYWSSTGSTLPPALAWLVDFYHGYVFNVHPSNLYYARCVRAGL
ncbi:MAG: hypothetical protein C0402_05725 [Thermodesulfovibrio sp.]|nr:hypothetical protein [Thermodesulfovibrio sp.]